VANFDIAVYPRRVDLGGRFSVKLAEFMACGVPVVSTNVSESFVIAEAGGGIVVESPEAFVQALVTLARSPDMRRSLGEAGRRFGQSLDWDMLAVRYQREVLDVYASA
jgi:glycosyltransferase involved in cell wall biosynthesis